MKYIIIIYHLYMKLLYIKYCAYNIYIFYIKNKKILSFEREMIKTYSIYILSSYAFNSKYEQKKINNRKKTKIG